ncbi:GNAT family N-acetyltransferase [Phanerochaete sordida]|uniref:GNAT family N-acetyltransferase n=1 Tax=Phanerochaete sordida TaxID=48140 RepID=A0A9P3GLA3_9APHY|nr:GNAT family N-acetyltransferase [Phanerochaete sordida]
MQVRKAGPAVSLAKLSLSPPLGQLSHSWRASQDTLCCETTGTEKGDWPPCMAMLDEFVKPELLQYGEVSTACATLDSSVDDDTLEFYLQAGTADDKDVKRYRTGQRMLYRMQFYRSILDRAAWTIEHGQSVIIVSDPAQKRRPLSKFFSPIYRSLVRGIRGVYQNKEQNKRSKEFVGKMEKAIEDTIGDRLAEMFEVSSLVTAPAYRRRGYATALVHVATDAADARGAPTWLASSNTVNRGFYHSLGFATVATFYLGTDNPAWKAPPVPIDIMVREPKEMDGTVREKAAYAFQASQNV